MKKLILLPLFITIGMVMYAQNTDDHSYHLEAKSLSEKTATPIDTVTADTIRYWTYGGDITINLSQVALKNWAAGGNSSIAATGIVNFFTRYEKNRFVWDAKINLAYGIQKQGKLKVRKSDDVIDFTSQLGYKFNDYWKLGFLNNFRSQFTYGYEYDDAADTRRLVSQFMAPAFVIAALGIEYQAPKFFKLFVSPVTSKSVIVLADAVPETKYGLDSNKTVFQNLGAYLVANFDAEIFKNVTLSTRLELFSNYLKHPENIDINWGTKVNMKVNNFLTVSLSTDLIYDDDINVPKEREDGTIYQGKGTQFRENLAIGIGYKFGQEKKK
ncbi:MAG: DUF3078 domain-containing protein [Chitinophagales bacterium]|nr:DUF3078 domain-containing protein [Chitinophagales bacterium]